MNARASWTEQQWAEYLDCGLDELAGIRETTNNKFYLKVFGDDNDGRWRLGVWQHHYSWTEREWWWQRLGSFERNFASEEEARQYSEDIIIPKLELNKAIASIVNLPTKALQLLELANA